MTLTPTGWHNRFVQQSIWTRDLRHYLFDRCGMEKARRVLEVGCGTGALLAELTSANVIGIDINRDYLHLASNNAPGAALVQGDAKFLPYAPGCFDLVYCHFFLLWTDDPANIVREMARVTAPGGAVMALAEPDYGGRIDYPPELYDLGVLQETALRTQGADPLMGRRLSGVFSNAGLQNIESGVLGGQWSAMPDANAITQEWEVLQADLQGLVSNARLAQFYAMDMDAWKRGERVLFVPTFFAVGHVPRRYAS